MQEARVRSLSREDPLEKEMAAHSSTLAWRIPWGRSLVGYSPWGRKESDTTKRLHSLTQSLICSVSRIVLYALGVGPKVWFLELQELVKYKFLDSNQIYWQKLPRWVIRWSWCMIFENHCSRGHTNEVKWNSVILISLHKKFLVSRNLSIVKKINSLSNIIIL